MSQPPYGPPQGPFAYPPPHGPVQAPKKPFYKKTWFVVLAGLTVLAIVGSADDSGTPENAGSAAAGGAATDEAAAGDAAGNVAVQEAPVDTSFAIGQPAPDGDFSFLVSGVDCGLTEIGTQYFGTKAQGQFCVVSVAVTNIGDEPGAFFGENAELHNAQGQEFSAHSEAAMYLDGADSFFEEINPGNTLNSKIVFDVPVGTTPTAIELHDSAFSGGVIVALQ